MSRLIILAVLLLTLIVPVASTPSASAATVHPAASIGCLENCGEWQR